MLFCAVPSSQALILHQVAKLATAGGVRGMPKEAGSRHCGQANAVSYGPVQARESGWRHRAIAIGSPANLTGAQPGDLEPFDFRSGDICRSIASSPRGLSVLGALRRSDSVAMPASQPYVAASISRAVGRGRRQVSRSPALSPRCHRARVRRNSAVGPVPVDAISFSAAPGSVGSARRGGAADGLACRAQGAEVLAVVCIGSSVVSGASRTAERRITDEPASALSPVRVMVRAGRFAGRLNGRGRPASRCRIARRGPRPRRPRAVGSVRPRRGRR